MTRKRDVALIKVRDMRAKLLQRAKNVKKKAVLKLMCEASLGIVVIAKEVNTLINK